MMSKNGRNAKKQNGEIMHESAPVHEVVLSPDIHDLDQNANNIIGSQD